MMMMMMKMMMMMADEGWARVNDLNLVMGCAQCLTLILLLAELCGVGLVSFSLSCAGHPLFIMTPQQQVKPTRPVTGGGPEGSAGIGTHEEAFESHWTCWSSIFGQAESLSPCTI